MPAVKAHELMASPKSELLKTLEDLKAELSTLRVSQVTGGAAQKLMRIRVVRKSIARVLTVYNTQAKEAQRKLYAGKKYQPKCLRAKTTRAQRRALTTGEKSIVTRKAQKKAIHFPARKFALKA
jgi:large subunit ribosomal protein L35e